MQTGFNGWMTSLSGLHCERHLKDDLHSYVSGQSRAKIKTLGAAKRSFRKDAAIQNYAGSRIFFYRNVRDPMIIFSDSRDPKRVPKTP